MDHPHAQLNPAHAIPRLRINIQETDAQLARHSPEYRIRYWKNKALIISATNCDKIIDLLDGIVNLVSEEGDKKVLRKWKYEILARLETPKDPGWNYYTEENMNSMRYVLGRVKEAQEHDNLVSDRFTF